MAEDDLINLNSLLHCLVKCSEKACSIAHVCRKDEELFQLLIEEKSESEKNKRFVRDFKTLADVLIQETVRWEINKMFPSIRSNVFGEENNSFKNTLGETITVQVLDSEEKTGTLLSKVLDGKHSAANALSSCVYQDIDVSLENLKRVDLCLPACRIGIWIDPIDSTGEYIQAKTQVNEVLIGNSLKCVTILIGAYDIETGNPILGIINQPFHTVDHNDEWRNKLYWGVNYKGYCESSLSYSTINRSQQIVVASSSEDQKILNILKNKYDVHFVAGAGYKCLLVARGDADLYILSRASTYFWDTCGPQAILMACGGSIIDFQKTMSTKNLNIEVLKTLHCKYSNETSTKYCNNNGIIVYKDPNVLIEFIRYFRNAFYTE